MDFFDANVFVGSPVQGGYEPAATAAELLPVMDRIGTSQALVWHIAQIDCSAQDGNGLVAGVVAANPRLVGCWAILPPQTGEVIREDFFLEMKRNGIAALRAFPDMHKYLLTRTTFGSFMDEVSEHRIPLLLSLERHATWPMVYSFLSEYPNLTCILCDVGIWGQDRRFWPLLESYPNVRVETSCVSIEAMGLEATVKRFGAERLVFGSSFPTRYPEAAAIDLMRADISDEEKQMIAGDNLRRIMAEVRL